jgi:hypothetical protein
MPSHENLLQLSSAPGLYHLALHQWTLHWQLSTELLAAFEWIRKRVEGILHGSMLHNNALPIQVESNIVVDGGWKKV